MADLITKFQKWLQDINQPIISTNQEVPQPSVSTNSNLAVNNNSENVPQPSVSTNSNSGVTNNSENSHQSFTINDFNSQREIKVFENNNLSVFIEKTVHRRLTRFKFLDNLFQIKVKVKDENNPPFLKDILEVFEEVFKFILNHLKTFFTADDHNSAYLTLFQEPMINGINTGYN